MPKHATLADCQAIKSSLGIAAGFGEQAGTATGSDVRLQIYFGRTRFS